MRNKCYNPRRAYVSAIFNPQQRNVTSATSVTKVYKSLHFAWHTLSDAWHTLLILASLTPSNVKVFYGFCGIRAYRMAYAPTVWHTRHVCELSDDTRTLFRMLGLLARGRGAGTPPGRFDGAGWLGTPSHTLTRHSYAVFTTFLCDSQRDTAPRRYAACDA